MPGWWVWSFPSYRRSGVVCVAGEVVKVLRRASFSAFAPSAGRGGEGGSGRSLAIPFCVRWCRWPLVVSQLRPAVVARGAASGGRWWSVVAGLVGVPSAGRGVVRWEWCRDRARSSRQGAVAQRRTSFAVFFKGVALSPRWIAVRRRRRRLGVLGATKDLIVVSPGCSGSSVHFAGSGCNFLLFLDLLVMCAEFSVICIRSFPQKKKKKKSSE